jgi:hypothetical protein
MSERHADRTRDQTRRKLRRPLREPSPTLVAGRRGRADEDAAAASIGSETAMSGDAVSRAASLAMQDEGGPTRCGD